MRTVILALSAMALCGISSAQEENDCDVLFGFTPGGGFTVTCKEGTVFI
jgi:hypothetical protein